MAPFVGRSAELAMLQAQWRAPGGAFVPVYGRRRIGKTELIHRFLGLHRGILHVGKVAPAGLQLREFLEVAARALDEPLLGELGVDSWRKALEAVVGRWKGPGKLVLAFDEFQWTAQASPELPSVLQELWDREWKRSGRVMLVLCGSFIGFMEREVLGSKSPLFGRRTAQLHLQPFPFSESRAFLPKSSLEHQALAWFLTGGVAQYLASFEDGRSFRQNVERLVLDEFAPLYREPEFLLREELREVGTYHAVLMAIAGGARTPREIAQRGGVPERGLHYNLEQLVQLGYVARRFPLTGERPRRTDVRFVLEDALLRFWFRFVFPHKSQMAQLSPSESWERLVAPQLESWAGDGFERLCRAALPRLLAKEGVRATVEVGAWWDRTAQVDVVGIRDDGVTELGACKWGPVSGASLQRELDRRVAVFPNPGKHTLRRHAFVRTWRGKVPEGLCVHRLEELA